jgi:hypothetical protein
MADGCAGERQGFVALFLSYSSDDRTFAETLRDALAPYVEVFFDTRSIAGGAEWEREIDRAIRGCGIFVPIVTKASNDSTWVAKETLLALRLEVPILPALVSETLPLRLVDRQFLDFRGSFEAGFSDLITAIGEHLGPMSPSSEVVDGLIAKAVRARLGGDIRTANALVEQIVGLESNLASSGYAFWWKLQSSLSTDLAGSSVSDLRIRETAVCLKENHPDEDHDWFRWTLEIHGTPEALDSIDSVEYRLHPSFLARLQKARSRENHFGIEREGWGTFVVHYRIEFIDYTSFEGRYMLTFEKVNEAPLESS